MRDASTPKSRMFLRPLFLGARQDCDKLARPNPAARRCLQLNAGELTRFNIAESYRTRERRERRERWTGLAK